MPPDKPANTVQALDLSHVLKYYFLIRFSFKFFFFFCFETRKAGMSAVNVIPYQAL